ncbi:uncharacterized protein ACRADG_005084 [Cochliomyia hominivorax]
MKLLNSLASLLMLVAHEVLIIGAVGYYRRFMNTFGENYYHGFWCLLALPVMGLALSVFRVCQGVDTRVVIYLHAILHAIPCYMIHHTMDGTKNVEWHYMHGEPARYVYYAYNSLVLVSLVLFCALPKGSARNVIASLHGTIGIWLYQNYIGVAMSGLHNCSKTYGSGAYKTETEISGLESHGCLLILSFYRSLLMAAAIILNVFLILPFFQWEEVTAF